MNTTVSDTIIMSLWAICGIVAVVMLGLFIMQASAESARFWEACVNSGGMTIANNCVKSFADLKDVVK